jgi:hypothetical protein
VDNTSREDIQLGNLSSNLTQIAVSNSYGSTGPMLDSDLQTIVASIDRLVETYEIDFGELSERSRSSWDRYIRQLTPDLPSFVPDALEVFLRARRFREFWHRIKKELSSDERERLIAWYRSTAESLSMRAELRSFLDSY